MLCPICKVDMLVLEFELVEIDYCEECGGVWLDSGELELIGERAGALQRGLLGALETHGGERPEGPEKRRCPICRKRLARVSTSGEKSIELDRCPAQHGLWFDRGELQAVITAAGADADNTLTRFFGKLKGTPENQEDSG